MRDTHCQPASSFSASHLLDDERYTTTTPAFGTRPFSIYYSFTFYLYRLVITTTQAR